MLKKVLFPIYILSLSSLFSSNGFAQNPEFPPLPQQQMRPMYSMPPMQRPMQPMAPYPFAMPGRAIPAPQPYAYAPPRPMQGQPQIMPLIPAPGLQTSANQKPFREFSGYLGLVLDIIPSSVAAQMPKGTSQGQGVLVKKFSENSPAETSDLKPFDVILSYDNTAVIHPAQFIKLVRDSEPNQKVILKVVRKGNIINVPVTLGSQQTPNPTEFNGLAIKRIGKNKYKANVRYVGPNGNKQLRTYEGNREEIFDQALNAQDLPLAEREQLLYATRPRKDNSKSGFGSFFPFGGKNESGNDWMNPGKFFPF